MLYIPQIMPIKNNNVENIESNIKLTNCDDIVKTRKDWFTSEILRIGASKCELLFIIQVDTNYSCDKVANSVWVFVYFWMYAHINKMLRDII